MWTISALPQSSMGEVWAPLLRRLGSRANLTGFTSLSPQPVTISQAIDGYQMVNL
jgi:hypothetical protein